MTAASSYIQPAPHEASGNLIFTEAELSPYYALHAITRGADYGEPVSGTFIHNSERYLATLKPKRSGLKPLDSPSFDFETVKEFSLQVEPEHAEAMTAPPSVTYTVSPRWPNMESLGDSPNPSTPDIFGVNVRFDGSNLPLEAYPSLLRRGMSVLDVNPTYFADVHPFSNLWQFEYYVRVNRERGKAVIGNNGPLRRIFEHVESEGSFRELREDDGKTTGYHHRVKVDSAGASVLVPDHQLGKQFKHYHPKHPRSDPSDPLYHPKIGVTYRSKHTEGRSVSWSNRDNLRREVDESLLNLLSWAGLPTRADSAVFVPDAHFDATETERPRTLIDDPTPEIRRKQDAAVPRVLLGSTESDRDVLRILADGGEDQTPEKLAERSGWSTRTIYRVLDRLSEILTNKTGSIRFASDYLADVFRDTVSDALDTLEADSRTATSDSTSAFTRWKHRYGVDVERSESAQLMFRFGRLPRDLDDILKEGFFAWVQTGGDEFQYRNATFRYQKDGYSQVQTGFDPLH